MIRMRPRWQMTCLTTHRVHMIWRRAVTTKPLSANSTQINNRLSNRSRILWCSPSSSSHLLHSRRRTLRCRTSSNHLHRSIKTLKSLRLLSSQECKTSSLLRNKCKRSHNPKCLLVKSTKAAIRICIKCSSTHHRASLSRWRTRMRRAATTMTTWAVVVA